MQIQVLQQDRLVLGCSTDATLPDRHSSARRYLLVPPEQGPDALGDSNLLALASRIADPLLHRLRHRRSPLRADDAAPQRYLCRDAGSTAREVGESRVRIVNLSDNRFFAFEPVDALGDKVMISDCEKTAIDCIDRPALAVGSIGTRLRVISNA